MFTVIACMLAGTLVGFLMRRRRLSRIGGVITVLIWLLLFLLGIEVGGNERVLKGLPTIGVEALVIAVATTLGSCIAAWGLWRWIGRKVGEEQSSGMENGAYVNNGNETGMYIDAVGQDKKGIGSAMKGSLVVVAFFVFGIAIGVLNILPFDISQTDISFYALCALMCSVGISIGNNPDTLRSFMKLNPRLLMLPIMTIVGTLAAAALVGLFMDHRTMSQTLALGSGFAYYSLSSIFITEYYGAELGTVALIANIIRELIALLCAPLLVRWFGTLAPISAGGATTMDTTLPIITGTIGERYAIVSIYHGFVVDFSVPFLITFFCSL